VTFLLDTNVLSEVTKPRPDAAVLQFLHEADEDRLFVSAVTLAEIHRGIALMPEGGRRRTLEAWVAGDFSARFRGRILPVDGSVAEAWGRIMGDTRRRGFAMHVMDGFIAATAKSHGLTIVTRNISDFADLGLTLFNPWSDAPPSPAAAPG
jgi:predicted nucleic acid-binding protein